MTAGAKPAPVPQLPALTGLRGIAAWWVVLYHARLSLTALLPEQAIVAFGYGYLAVDLFFLLSGFVMWLNYGDRFATGGLAQAPAFWWRRIARVWPLHAAMLAGLLPFALIVHLSGRDGSAYPLAELPLHLLLVQNWGFTQDLTWNHPAWSVSAELAAYLAFPLIALLLARGGAQVPLLLVQLVVAAAALHGLFAWHGYDNLGAAIPQLGMWRCLAQFTMGMVLCRLWQGYSGRTGAGLVALSAGLLLLTGLWFGLAQTFALPLAFAAILLALALDRGPISRALGSGWLRRLGDWSYATYLAHVPLLIVIKLLFVGEDLQISGAVLALYLAALLAASAALYHGLERPAQAWLRDHPPFLPRRAGRPV